MSYLADEIAGPWLAASLLTAINTELEAAGYTHPDDQFDTEAGICDGLIALASSARLPALGVSIGASAQVDRRGGRIGVYQTQVTVYVALAAASDASLRATARAYLDIIRATIDSTLTGFELLQCTSMDPIGVPYSNDYELPSLIATLGYMAQLECDETTQ